MGLVQQNLVWDAVNDGPPLVSLVWRTRFLVQGLDATALDFNRHSRQHGHSLCSLFLAQRSFSPALLTAAFLTLCGQEARPSCAAPRVFSCLWAVAFNVQYRALLQVVMFADTSRRCLVPAEPPLGRSAFLAPGVPINRRGTRPCSGVGPQQMFRENLKTKDT